MTTYNGYKNRSTWLAKLHLDNTSKEVWNEYEALKARYAVFQKDVEANRKNTNMSAYPFHQHAGIEKDFKSLLAKTTFGTEKECEYKEVDMTEVLKD